MNKGGDNPEFVLQEYGGINCLDAREAIGDEEFYWLENLMPVARGELVPVAAKTSIATIGESGTPTYTTQFNVAGVDYAFAVWAGSGNAWIVNLATNATTQIATGLYTSGQTSAVSWNDAGLLIIDPTGYWDWNVTTASTLTPHNNGAASLTNTLSNITTGGAPSYEQTVTGTAPTGFTWTSTYQVVNAQVTTAGTGFAIGDIVNLTDNNPTVPATITVTAIGAGGSITGASLSSGGSYPGPNSPSTANVGPSGSVFTTTGSGTGAVFVCHIQTTGAVVTNPGTGGSGVVTIQDVWKPHSVFTPASQWTVNLSGVVGGTAISAYAGRVWIASGRTVSFTDVNSYLSFGGAGGAFTITDSWLHTVITALFAANNYLYIFGDSSIDVLSNVTITSGVTSFTRINVTASVGTSQPTSVFAYYRSIAFYHGSGFYTLSGSTPQKISEKISGVIQNAVVNNASNYKVYGCQVQLQGELCASFLLAFNDDFSPSYGEPITFRTVLMIYFRGKWFAAFFANALNFNQPQAMLSVPTAGVSTIYWWFGNALSSLFTSGVSTVVNQQLSTRLWTAGSVFREKQAINAAVGYVPLAAAPVNITLNVDTELANNVNFVTAPAPTSTAYQFWPPAVHSGQSQYVGLSMIVSATNIETIRIIGLRAKQDRDMISP